MSKLGKVPSRSNDFAGKEVKGKNRRGVSPCARFGGRLALARLVFRGLHAAACLINWEGVAGGKGPLRWVTDDGGCFAGSSQGGNILPLLVDPLSAMTLTQRLS
jgi:hypothetical protein